MNLKSIQIYCDYTNIMLHCYHMTSLHCMRVVFSYHFGNKCLFCIFISILCENEFLQSDEWKEVMLKIMADITSNSFVAMGMKGHCGIHYPVLWLCASHFGKCSRASRNSMHTENVHNMHIIHLSRCYQRKRRPGNDQRCRETHRYWIVMWFE